LIEVAARLVAVTAGLVLAGGSAGVAQHGFPLPPEAPARMPSATTLPNYRSNPPLGPEAPLSARLRACLYAAVQIGDGRSSGVASRW